MLRAALSFRGRAALSFRAADQHLVGVVHGAEGLLRAPLVRVRAQRLAAVPAQEPSRAVPPQKKA